MKNSLIIISCKKIKIDVLLPPPCLVTFSLKMHLLLVVRVNIYSHELTTLNISLLSFYCGLFDCLSVYSLTVIQNLQTFCFIEEDCLILLLLWIVDIVKQNTGICFVSSCVTFLLICFYLFFLHFHFLEKAIFCIYFLVSGLFELKRKSHGIYLVIFKQLDSND